MVGGFKLFKNLIKKDFSYILGFLHGDGSYYEQTRNRGRISIELSYKDKDILDKFEEILSEIGVKVGRGERVRDTTFKKNYRTSQLNIYDWEFRKFIKVPVGKKPSIIDPYNYNTISKDYIRGLTDADGSMGITSKNRPFWSLTTSSDKVKEFILENIEKVTGVEKEINRNKRDNVYNITLFDEDAIEYLNYLYKDSNLYLERKFKSYKYTLTWQRTVPKRSSCGRWKPHEVKVLLSEEFTMDEKLSILKHRTYNSIKSKLNKLNIVTKN